MKNRDLSHATGLLRRAGWALLFGLVASAGNAQRIEPQTNSATGALQSLHIANDTTHMNWMMETDGSQYAWVTEKYGWGLGYLTATTPSGETKQLRWEQPVHINKNGREITYRVGNLSIAVRRTPKGDDLIESYTLRNESTESLKLTDIGIYTPFNDNYPDSRICIPSRANAHIWGGGNAAYVDARRMGGAAPHLGLVVTRGAVKSYEIWERGREKANSQYRGIIALNLPDMQLAPGKAYTVEWRIFSHQGTEEFVRKQLALGSISVSCNQYVFNRGDTARIRIAAASSAGKCRVSLNGKPLSTTRRNGCWEASAVMDKLGEARFDIAYGKGRQSYAECLVVSHADSLVARRVAFILRHQQMQKPEPRQGAYMVYDNEGDSIYLNDTPNCNPADRSEGDERVGMGVLLAQYYRLHPSEALKNSLLQYARFLRTQLQDDHYRVFDQAGRRGRNRGYNYVWVADFYFHLYEITGDKQYATDGYRTMQALYREFKYGFYCIGTPVLIGFRALKAAGMQAEHDDLLSDFRQTAAVYLKNSIFYPKFEVNYEQSIAAPAVVFLLQLYAATNEPSYLAEARRQLPVVEAFNGNQPSFHLNEIAIRHWDGYWFGKRETWGDTMPHYWSAITAVAYHLYAQSTGEAAYQRRAENIVRNNLCLFFEDGRASCAYLYPHRVNGRPAGFYDPYANDQDWALVYYLFVNHDLL